ncbi:MAG: glycosyltransferase family 2 protein [Deltaproteobacteria bacterium]|nr:glycosyltransferase family 2 protein [Deltaproteobacteria bacterium]MBN2671764.1 glycosyltransferase family 2 protein [Deltaproteobacteria bacterium]
MLDGKSIAVVVPAYNESLLLKKTISSIPDYVDYICIVNDASTDETAKVIEQMHHPKINLISHGQNQGVGAAIISGYRRCMQLQADVIAVMAGDAQMDPHDLHAIVSPVVSDLADYCKGDRLSWKGVFKVMPLLRFFGNHALSLLTRITSGYLEVRDSQCGYTAISRHALTRLRLERIYARYGFPNDILAHLFTINARLSQVTVRPIYATEKSGISLYTAFIRVPLVLLRSYVFRLKHRPAKVKSLSPTSIERA